MGCRRIVCVAEWERNARGAELTLQVGETCFDDFAQADAHCCDSEREKLSPPNIERLAVQGMRFTDGHSSSCVCSPMDIPQVPNFVEDCPVSTSQ